MTLEEQVQLSHEETDRMLRARFTAQVAGGYYQSGVSGGRDRIIGPSERRREWERERHSDGEG